MRFKGDLRYLYPYMLAIRFFGKYRPNYAYFFIISVTIAFYKGKDQHVANHSIGMCIDYDVCVDQRT